MKENNPKL